MKASIGRIVHFTHADGKPRAAIVASVADEEKQSVNLHLLGDGGKETGVKAIRQVPFSAEPKKHHWSWPPQTE